MADREDEARLSAAFKPSVPVFYSNVINMTSTIHDIRLTFGKARSGTDLTFDVAVYLPHTAAKQLVILLANTIDEHEKAFGEIRLEPLEQKK